MIRRKMIGLAAAATLAGGLGVYGAASAFAATTAPTPPASSSKPTPSASSTSPAGRDAMIRHCTDHLPAGERAKARQQMQRMMSGGGTMMSGGTAGSSMMGDNADSAGKG